MAPNFAQHAKRWCHFPVYY